MGSSAAYSYEQSRQPAMALSQPLHERKRMGTGSHLLTPEEPTIDSFEDKQPVRLVEPRSPPESPAFPPLSSSGEDRVLYPESDNDHSAVPLFDTNNTPSTPRETPERGFSPSPVVADQSTRVLEARTAFGSHQWAQVTDRPGSSGAIGFVQRYNADPAKYYKQCMEEHEARRRLKLDARQLPPPSARPAKRDSHTQRLVESLGKSRVAKAPPTTTTIRARTERVAPPVKPARAVQVEEARRSQSPIIRHSRQTSASSNGLGGLSSAAAPKPRTRQPPSKVVERKDQHWNEIDDYCPPKESLDTMDKKLSVEWTNKNHQDLSQDPDRQHLHAQELVVASTLRLKCDRYLLIKRLIFQEKVRFLKENKEFNKTSAQNCCNVDVNKISKLWQSFNDVGWFDRHWFTQYLT